MAHFEAGNKEIIPTNELENTLAGIPESIREGDIIKTEIEAISNLIAVLNYRINEQFGLFISDQEEDFLKDLTNRSNALAESIEAWNQLHQESKRAEEEYINRVRAFTSFFDNLISLSDERFKKIITNSMLKANDVIVTATRG